MTSSGSPPIELDWIYWPLIPELDRVNTWSGSSGSENIALVSSVATKMGLKTLLGL